MGDGLPGWAAEALLTIRKDRSGMLAPGSRPLLPTGGWQASQF